KVAAVSSNCGFVMFSLLAVGRNAAPAAFLFPSIGCVKLRTAQARNEMAPLGAILHWPCGFQLSRSGERRGSCTVAGFTRVAIEECVANVQLVKEEGNHDRDGKASGRRLVGQRRTGQGACRTHSRPSACEELVETSDSGEEPCLTIII